MSICQDAFAFFKQFSFFILKFKLKILAQRQLGTQKHPQIFFLNSCRSLEKIFIPVELGAHFRYNIRCDLTLTGIDFIIDSFIDQKS